MISRKMTPAITALAILCIFSHPAAGLSLTPKNLALPRVPPTRRHVFLAIGSAFFLQPSHATSPEDYTTTPSNLRYLVTKPPTDPTSPRPVRGQKVEMKYTLYLGGFPGDAVKVSKIDSSSGILGEKAFKYSAGVSQVIKGWDLTVLDMRVGEGRRIIVPA